MLYLGDGARHIAHDSCNLWTLVSPLEKNIPVPQQERDTFEAVKAESSEVARGRAEEKTEAEMASRRQARERK